MSKLKATHKSMIKNTRLHLIQAVVGLITALLFGVASAASVRASYDVPYETGLFGNTPSADFKSKALDTGRLEVWKVYQSRLDSSKLQELERNRAAVEARLPDIVTNLNILDEQVIKDSRIVKYTVRATINTTFLETLLQGASGVAESGGGSLVGFLFVPRRQAETKVFDATVTTTVRATAAESTENVISDEIGETGAGIEERTTQGTEARAALRTTTSGSTTRRAAQSTWEIVEAIGVDAEVNKVLTESGYEAATFDDILAECGQGEADDIISDLVNSQTMNFGRDNNRIVGEALRECEVRFFGVGFLTIDSIERDNQTGGWMVRVAVNVNVRDYGPVHAGERRVAATVATVQESSSGLGRTQESATDSALQDAGRKAASIISSQLRSKGLR